MRLLVTGGCGFIGSNFINYYFKENTEATIINLDAMYYCASEMNINEDVRNSDRYHLIKGNLCSYDLVFNILNIYQIDTIIHFAAQSHVQNSFEDALQYTHDNVQGTHTLLEACRKYDRKYSNQANSSKINRFIHISTDEVYGESMINENEEKKNENSILCPTNPYAATKAAAELIAKSYYHSFKMPIIITRGNNVYGPNQYPEKLIPRFIQQLSQNKKVTIQGDGSNVRAFLHVNDVCSALKLVLENGEIGEIYNVGSDDHHEYTVLQIAHILIQKIKNIPPSQYNDWITYIDDRPFNDKRYYISNEKVKQLGWTIDMDFDKGINELINTMMV
jgi:dTDP-glucose 4,6-dehydratase